MATPEELRKRQAALTRLAANELAAVWRQVSNAAEARKALRDILPALIRNYGMAAASVAADWYDEARAIADVSGAFTAIPASLEEQASDALSLWASEKGTDLAAIRALVEGGMSRRIANWSRETIVGSALADPRANGWQRVGVGSCAFCALLISRGTVYSERTADFASHDWCQCGATPAFKGKVVPVKPYTPSLRGSTQADRDRVRAYIAKHPYV